MTASHLKLVKDGLDVEAVGEGPPSSPPMNDAAVSFKRLVTTPAAWPWRQRQMAELDARHGSPLPADQVAFQLSRLEPWRAGRPGQFAVVYTRATAGRAGARQSQGALADLMTAILPSRRTSSDLTATGPWLVGVAYLAATLLFAFALSTAWQRRTDTVDDLDQLQRRIQLAERRAAETAAAKRQAGELLALGVQDHSSSHVLADMAWVSQHLTPDTPVQAFHWRQGVAAVEVAGPGAPFTAGDRRVQRASKPLRTGGWLWGVEPQGPDPGHGEP